MCIRDRANPELHVVGNTLYDVDAGFSSPGGGVQEHHLINNIIANLAEPSHHVAVAVSGVAANSEMRNNLFYQPGAGARIKWGSSSGVYDLATFQATFGKGQGSLEADPVFVDAAGGDFQLQNGPGNVSPAIDAGASMDSYVDLFANLYGLDIGVDLEGTARPQGDGIDIGAFEALPSSPGENQSPVATDDSASTDEDNAVVVHVLDNDTDPDAEDTLIAGWVTQGTHGTVTTDGTSVTYTPESGWHGKDTFTYTVSDGNGGTDTATVTVTVSATNDEPGTLVIEGTPGADVFLFTAHGETFNVTLNGQVSTYNVADVSSVEFDGKGGYDTAWLRGDTSNDVVRFYARNAGYIRSDNYRVDVFNTEKIRAYRTGGYDRAFLHGSARADVLRATPAYGWMTGTGFDNMARGFDSVYAFSNGGDDRAYLHGSARADVFKAARTLKHMQGSGYHNYARGFKQVRVYAKTGYDRAYLYGTSQRDHLYAYASYVQFRSSGCSSWMHTFDRVQAYAMSVVSDILHRASSSLQYLSLIHI